MLEYTRFDDLREDRTCVCENEMRMLHRTEDICSKRRGLSDEKNWRYWGEKKRRRRGNISSK